MPAVLCPASRSAKIHRTCGAVAGSGSRGCRRRPPAGVCGVGVWSGVDETVSVGWSAAEVSALVAGLDPHRGHRPEPGPQHFAPRLVTEQHEQRLMCRIGPVDWAAELWQPQLDAVAVEHRLHLRELAAGERPLVFTDHDRVEPAIGAGRRGEQFGRLRSAWPGAAAGTTDVEELGHDPAVAGDHVGGAVTLPPP
jgi:hypothetical protein